MAVIKQIKSWVRSLPTQVYKRIDEDASCDEALGLLEGGRDETVGRAAASKAAKQDPSCYAISPLQRWLTPVMKNVTKTGSFEADDLPNFSIDTAYLRQFLVPLKQRRLLAFISQKQIGGKLLLSGCLELTSSLCSLAGPIMLRNLMQNPSLPQVLLLLAASVLGTVCGRAKDQICRVQATQIAAMLKSGLYEKSLRLSVGSRAEFPAGTIINISSHDVSFFRNYFLKVHDLWSAILQILVIFSLVLWIMGKSCLIAFAFMFMLFASQSKANFLAKDSVTGYISSNDGRLKYYRDFLYNVKAVKIQSLEGHFMRKINDFRNIQLKRLRSYLRLIFCFFSSMNQMIPALTATLAFLSYWWADYELTVEVVFPVLALFDLIHQPAGKLSISVTRQFLVLPSLRRVLSLLTAEEDSKSMLGKPLSERNAVEFDHAEISYPSALEKEQGDTNADFRDLTDPFTLGPLNFSFPKNKLSIVVGPVGSGKSTLLSVLAGYLPASKQNSVRMQQGRVALCTQEPWIQSCSVRENILFMSAWDEVRYREVVRACCLEQDFSRWPAGDRTIVGEKGATLSGGQRARISLARAVYSQADLILLDDPLAAVDAYVGNCLFRDCIRKLQQTVILVTHQTAFLPHADYIIALHNAQVVEYGTRQDLLERAPGYAHSLLPLGTDIDSTTSTSSSSSEEGSKPNVDESESSVILEKLDSSLHEAEERATGHVKADIYIFYFKHAGGRRFLLRLAIIFLFSLAVRVINSYWFVWWLSDAFKLQQGLYMFGYMSLTLGQAISLTSVGIFSVTASLNASRSIHASIMRNLFHARMSYFESQPIGRILNRLSSDMDAMDSDLMNSVDGLFNAGGQITASVITILVSAPWLLVIMVPAMWFAYTIQTLYRVSARELRRLSSILDSPVVATLSEALGAASTIKAYHAHKFFLSIYDGFINPANSAAIVKDSLDTWVTTRAEFISAAMVLGCGILYVSNVLSPLQAGLALSTSITFTKNVYLLLWALIQLEVEMNSVERLRQYVTNIPQEPEDQESLLEMTWPRSGDIEFKDVSLTYHTDRDLALDHVSIKVNAGQKIGLVGRTGSGKTTLVSTLSRLVEILSGKITIDGVDIRDIPLNRLRSSVYVLPQEPFLFEGTLRDNLDYNDSHTDEQLWFALELCGLSNFFKSNNSAGQNPGPFSQRSGFGLNFELSSGGKNLSAGQTQLLCMARAVLRRPKILVIDEATASVDPQSDKIIQHVLQTEFSNTTILCIAHRIATLVWMDQIVVMEDGRVVEQGSPRMLLLQTGKDGVGESRYRKLMRMNGDGFLQEMILECKQ